ncbi:DUF1801 domain-containing protein [Cellulosimicrobium cellulans]|jgi:hypothetical protein|uniref:YdhG-like domain-containing protein n=1 Tax=Cellulosimicrobium cellulans TaxID=1710 RepID=A0A4Y4E567_CELCE|nr:DUF1801 domain-containing protein [Cellulosimicrobium cellulans]GED11055.1 hypothetical protein CCE02nite_30540 [Cellulosimicrobium cellulans]
MASENTTQPTDADVEAFLAAVSDPVRRRDAHRLVELLSRITGEPPRMWGSSIVGFGTYHYRYASGREGDMAAAGFSPRKAATTVYLMDGVDAHAALLDRLGPHTVGKGCVYVKDLDAVDLGVLEEVVKRSYATLTGDPELGRRLSGPSAGEPT